MSRRRAERGQTTPLMIGFFLIGVLLVSLVVDASAAYLQRQRLDSLADGAALAAAEAIAGDQVYAGTLGDRAPLDPRLAREYVADHLAALAARNRLPGLRYRVTTRGNSIEVRMTAPLDLPLVPPGWGTETTVSGTAAAVVQVRD